MNMKSKIKCPHCKGLGYTKMTIDTQEIQIRQKIFRIPSLPNKTICEKCKGYGELDWIEAVVGKKSLLIDIFVADAVWNEPLEKNIFDRKESEK